MIFRVRLSSLGKTFLALGVLAFAMPSFAQHHGGGQRGGGGGQRGGGGGHQSTPRPVNNRPSTPRPTNNSRPVNNNNNKDQAHARRDVVRTNNYVPRGQNAPRNNGPTHTQGPSFSRPPRIGNNVRHSGGESTQRAPMQRRFTKTTQGRRYDNGLLLHHGIKVTNTWQRRYFPHGSYHFRYYRPSFIRGSVFISPFGFYFGVCAPYLDVSICKVYPPSVMFVDEPAYNGNTCTGFQHGPGDNLLNDPSVDQNEPGLLNAIDELTETFQNGNIDSMASLIDPNTMIAVYLRGKYRYSLDGDDYMDLTRDAIRSTQTVGFNLTYLEEREQGVFTASGEQTYRNQNGQTRTVYVSFALQDIGGQWTLTQVCTAPDLIQSLKGS